MLLVIRIESKQVWKDKVNVNFCNYADKQNEQDFIETKKLYILHILKGF